MFFRFLIKIVFLIVVFYVIICQSDSIQEELSCAPNSDEKADQIFKKIIIVGESGVPLPSLKGIKSFCR
jgi:hypothetical protein